MKTTSLRILFTLAVLAGMAAAPHAQTFTWQAGRSYDAADRAERAADQARRNAERIGEQARRNAERIVAQAQRNADRQALQIERNVRLRIREQVRIQTMRARNLGRDIGRSVGRNLGSAFSSRSADYAGAERQVGGDSDPCRDNNYGDRDADHFCEVRESTMPAGALNVDAGQNGGISVEGWDRNEIRVRAIVQTSSRDDNSARNLAGQVQVQSGGGRVYATGPENLRRQSWSVSYRINVPRKNDLDLRASNGGITINGVTGNMRFDTTNGGVRLNEVGGRVNGETRNGGLNVTLAGSKWDGESLDVRTSNGGVNLMIPDGYNAELETGTVNGGLRIEFPITVQGELTGRNGLSTTLGSGGPLVRVRTTNGGVTIRRR